MYTDETDLKDVYAVEKHKLSSLESNAAPLAFKLLDDAEKQGSLLVELTCSQLNTMAICKFLFLLS